MGGVQRDCSLGLSATSQQYFSLTSNQPAVLFSQNKPAPAISHQPTEQAASNLVRQQQCGLTKKMARKNLHPERHGAVD
jgi:hypothetical protein